MYIPMLNRYSPSRQARLRGGGAHARTPAATMRPAAFAAAVGVIAPRAGPTPPARPTPRAAAVRVTRHDAAAPRGAPRLVFLPGLDGAPLAAPQAARVARAFRAVSVAHAAESRAGWDALAAAVAAVVEAEAADAGGGAVVLVGESFGAALALRVAALRPAGLRRLVLINSGTALGRDAALAAATRLLPLLWADGSGRVLYRAAGALLVRGLLADARRRRAAGGAPPRGVDIDAVPLDAMLHRVRLLREWHDGFGDGCVRRLVDVPTTLVASRRDRLLRSVDEARRLASVLPRVVRTVVLEESAHACLLEDGVRLDELVGGGGGGGGGGDGDGGDDARAYEDALQLGRRVLAPWRALAAPVFTGRERVAEAMRTGAQTGRPVLFVGNHGVYGLLDTPLLIEELSRLVGGRVRALAHETHFSQFSDLTGGRWGRFVRSIGAVPATARNFYRLLRAGGPVLLFPGGPSEVCRRRGERNVLRWRDETDFVRPAARLDAIIVPFSSAGADDAVDLLIDGQEMQRLPVVGPALTRLLRDNNFDPEHVMPIGAPPKPGRFKFEFHAPISTAAVDAGDPAACAALYREIRETVQAGITRLSSGADSGAAARAAPDPSPLSSLRGAVSMRVAGLLEDLLPM